VSEGGTDNLQNLVMCCSRCNSHRGVLAPEVFKKMIQEGYYRNLGRIRNEAAERREQKKLDNPKKQQQNAEFLFYLALFLFMNSKASFVVEQFLAEGTSKPKAWAPTIVPADLSVPRTRKRGSRGGKRNRGTNGV